MVFVVLKLEDLIICCVLCISVLGFPDLVNILELEVVFFFVDFIYCFRMFLEAWLGMKSSNGSNWLREM